MQTAAGLTTGTAQQKAEIVRNIISEYGVDINTLDAVLAGTVANKKPTDDIEAIVAQRIQPFQQHLQKITQQTQAQNQRMMQDTQRELTEFAASHEFYEDLREDMADLMELAAKRGTSLSLEAAYKKAADMNSEVKGIMELRARRTSMVDKKKAASSLRTTSTAPAVPNSANTSRIDDLAAAFDSLADKD